MRRGRLCRDGEKLSFEDCGSVFEISFFAACIRISLFNFRKRNPARLHTAFLRHRFKAAHHPFRKIKNFFITRTIVSRHHHHNIAHACKLHDKFRIFRRKIIKPPYPDIAPIQTLCLCRCRHIHIYIVLCIYKNSADFFLVAPVYLLYINKLSRENFAVFHSRSYSRKAIGIYAVLL